jgi:hypothetical protein
VPKVLGERRGSHGGDDQQSDYPARNDREYSAGAPIAK